MKYERFEDLPVWKAAIELAERVYCLTRRRFLTQPGDLRDQIRRAALSVSNNIAEGFERGSTAELLAFLYIVRGSALAGQHPCGRSKKRRQVAALHGFGCPWATAMAQSCRKWHQFRPRFWP